MQAFESSCSCTTAFDSSFTLVFDSASKAITRFKPASGLEEEGPGISSSCLVLLSNLDYDSASIFVPDSSFANHVVSAGYVSSDDPPFDEADACNQQFIAVSSIDLSGNFRPTTLIATSGVSMPVVPQSGMTVSIFNGAIQCSFPSSDHARTMELYSPLGVMAASLGIPAGQSEISLPHLMSGLYFVRMDGNVIKVAVP